MNMNSDDAFRDDKGLAKVLTDLKRSWLHGEPIQKWKVVCTSVQIAVKLVGDADARSARWWQQFAASPLAPALLDIFKLTIEKAPATASASSAGAAELDLYMGVCICIRDLLHPLSTWPLHWPQLNEYIVQQMDEFIVRSGSAR